MKILMKTVNRATLNFAQAILNEADIPWFMFDNQVSIMEGSNGAIPQRLMVIDADYTDAIEALIAADLEKELFRG